LGTFESSFYSKNQVSALLNRYLVISAYNRCFSSEIEAEEVIESLREGTFLEESLPIVTLGAVSILEFELISFSQRR